LKRLFGTDGIRGVAGETPLDRPTLRCIGAAMGEAMRRDDGSTRRVVLGRDTRESGPWIRDALIDGLASQGIEPADAGVISTPGLAYVLRNSGFHAGVMISASHNPFGDNGIKVFGNDAGKLSDASEQLIERRVLDDSIDDPGVGTGKVNGAADPALLANYIKHLTASIPHGRFEGVRVVLDCANGSACAIAPDVFEQLGAEVVSIGDRPDGRNINHGCGSTHLQLLQEALPRHDALVGFAFDGDADRCLAVDRRGRVIDGDHILYLLGRRMKRDGQLKANAVVATIMSNFWLEERLGQEGIQLLRAPVGDKYVRERMLEEGSTLGGEQSGHVILAEHATTGDGILTALFLLDTILGEEVSLETTLDGIEPYPQLLLNVRVSDKPDLREHARIGPVVRDVEARLAGKGRVVLRYSGTEPLARVMLEGKDESLVREQAERLAETIRRELGV